MGVECGNNTVWPVRDDRLYRFYTCNVNVKIEKALPNVTSEDIKSALNLPEGITANNDLNFKTVHIGHHLKVFDRTASISVTEFSFMVQEPNGIMEWFKARSLRSSFFR